MLTGKYVILWMFGENQILCFMDEVTCRTEIKKIGTDTCHYVDCRGEKVYGIWSTQRLIFFTVARYVFGIITTVLFFTVHVHRAEIA